jgi:hypothetical protein
MRDAECERYKVGCKDFRDCRSPNGRRVSPEHSIQKTSRVAGPFLLAYPETSAGSEGN